MKYALLILALTIAGCSTNSEPDCFNYTFIQFVSYNGLESYRFERASNEYFFFSDETLNLELNKEYTVCLDGELITSIYKK